MEHLLALAPSPGPQSAAFDLYAVQALAEATNDGDPVAAGVSTALNDLLTAGYIHAKRADRMAGRAALASLNGQHGLSELISMAAADEMGAAEEMEATAIGLVRSMHDQMGYLSAEETKLLSRKKFEESMSAGQAERVLDALSNKLYQSASNFGMADDELSAENPDGPDEMGEDDIGADIGLVADILGGDMPLVFGASCYSSVRGVFGASQEKLEGRLVKLTARLDKIKERISSLEADGKSGLRVKVLNARKGRLEKRIEKIKSKIKSLKDASAKVAESAKKADEVKVAESSAVKSAAASSVPTDDADLLDESEEEGEESDEALGAELALYGLSERRAERIEERIEKLQAKAEEAESAGHERKANRLKRRILRLQRRLDAAPDEEDAGTTPTSSARSFSKEAMTVKDPAAFNEQSYLSSFAGSLNKGQERQPYIGYFARLADAAGSPNRIGADEREGFFARLAEWFQSNLVDPFRSKQAVNRRKARRAAFREGLRRAAGAARDRARVTRSSMAESWTSRHLSQRDDGSVYRVSKDGEKLIIVRSDDRGFDLLNGFKRLAGDRIADDNGRIFRLTRSGELFLMDGPNSAEWTEKQRRQGKPVEAAGDVYRRIADLFANAEVVEAKGGPDVDVIFPSADGRHAARYRPSTREMWMIRSPYMLSWPADKRRDGFPIPAGAQYDELLALAKEAAKGRAPALYVLDADPAYAYLYKPSTGEIRIMVSPDMGSWKKSEIEAGRVVPSATKAYQAIYDNVVAPRLSSKRS